ncbi:Response regulator [Roseibacterium elongatum DSM 19469]|uniref:Response regulator n=1 Tax=Roseicyclus elongatus DSM 19469 TaxID=1294273 RepID=W8S1E3_9RHOB|nr:response regulator [Roseibacterium elongatum]AHM02541.1 Response regulator [Roseibacterium elongatum DSM 19469]
MDDALTDLTYHPRPSADRPLLGLTVLAVEDSVFSSEALRLMCQRSGARLRRADCIASAKRHLNVYRPTVAIVDLGLPDGSGLDLIGLMATITPRVPIIIGTSGSEREAAAQQARAAGADGFLPKPLDSLAAFQAELLRHLPPEFHPSVPREVETNAVQPDALALREDLTHAMHLLALERPPIGYLRRFLIGLARSVDDDALEGQALAMGSQGIGTHASDQAKLRALISQRLQAMPMAI